MTTTTTNGKVHATPVDMQAFINQPQPTDNTTTVTPDTDKKPPKQRKPKTPKTTQAQTQTLVTPTTTQKQTATKSKKSQTIQPSEAVLKEIRKGAFKASTPIIDYLDCSKHARNLMVVLEGNRLDHNKPVGVAAIGKVYLQTSGKRRYLGELTENSLILDGNIWELTDKSELITNTMIFAIKTDVEKQWCLSKKSETLRDRDTRITQKNQDSIARQKAIADLL